MTTSTRLAIAVSIAALQVIPQAQAGTLTARLTTYPASAGTGAAEVKLAVYDSSIADLKPRDSRSWTYAFKNDGAIGVTLVFAIQGAPTGFSSPKYDADLPFYLEDLPLSLQGVLIKQDTDDHTARKLVKEVSARIGRADKPEFVSLYQRVKDMYVARHALGDAQVLKVDVSLAYWFVVLSREMYVKNYVLPSEDSINAADWLDRQTTDNPESFGTNSVAVADANSAVKGLKSWGITKYQRLLTEIDRRLQSAATKERACRLAKALFYDVRGIDPDNVPWSDPDHVIRLGAATSLAYCLADQRPAEIDPQTVTDVRADLEAFSSAGNDAAQRNAIGRLHDLMGITPSQGQNG